MGNSFVIDSFRFHAKERNKFLVKGWFEDESQVSEHQLEVWLDGIELDKSIEKSVNTGIALFPKRMVKHQSGFIRSGLPYREILKRQKP